MNSQSLLQKILLVVITCQLLCVSTQAVGNQKLTLVLDWFTNPNHAPIFVAKEQGFFNRHGLDVDIISPADPTDPPKWVAVGKVDIALDYQPQVMIQKTRGLPIQQIGTLIDQPLNCLVVLASSSIKSLEDLRGKQIAYSAPEVDLLILKTMLNKAHLTLKDVELINVHYDLMHALLSNKVDAAIGMMRNLELIQLRRLGKPGRAFFPEQYGVPAYSELVFIGNSKITRDDRYTRFFQALNEARDYLLMHPQDSWQQFVAHHAELNTPLNKEVWFQTLPKFASHFEQINSAQRENLASYLSHGNRAQFASEKSPHPSP